MPDLIDYTDEALEELRIMVLTEQERRTRLETAVENVAATTTQYVEAGGSKADLIAAVESAGTTP